MAVAINIKNLVKKFGAVKALNDVSLDMLEMDLKNIWNILGEIIGESYSEELIDQLFSQFCLGK